MSIVVTGIALVVGAQWAVSQTQIGNVEKGEEANRIQLSRDAADVKATLGDYLTKETHRAYLEGTREQLDSLRARVKTLEDQQAANLSKLAHDPVEDRTFQAVTKSTDDKISLLQNQINTQIADVNLQLAAALKAMADISIHTDSRSAPQH